MAAHAYVLAKMPNEVPVTALTSLRNLEPPDGIEPSTSRLPGGRSHLMSFGGMGAHIVVGMRDVLNGLWGTGPYRHLAVVAAVTVAATAVVVAAAAFGQLLAYVG